MRPAISILFASALLAAADTPPAERDLTLMSLTELMNLDITSAAKKSQKLSRVPAAIYVITAEDIRRSGMNSVPELLRMVPGLDVARIDGYTWAISARGFNNKWSNKLLVLIDGRSVYSPVYAGVNWYAQDMVLADIARIEVIRGPGAAIWGANAVNGVINIVTKTAAETQGGSVEIEGGNRERIGRIRYGGELRPHAHYRVWAKYLNRGRQPALFGPSRDGGGMSRGGFRLDWDASTRDTFTLQGDTYQGRQEQSLYVVSPEPPYVTSLFGDQHASGGNLLARWTHAVRNSESELQIYCDYFHRVGGSYRETVRTADFEFRHRHRAGTRHDLEFGTEGRFTGISLGMNTGTFRQDPVDDALVSAFVQDEVHLIEDRLSLVAGSRIERTRYSGVLFQPAIQLAWTPSATQTVWFSAARAMRTPSLVERDTWINLAAFPGAAGQTNLMILAGNAGVKSESLLAWQAGYRIQATEWLSLDGTGFYNIYDNLVTYEQAAPYVQGSYLVIPFRSGNGLKARSYGLELATTWQPLGRWKLNTGYSWNRVRPRSRASVLDLEAERLDKDTPRHQFQFRSYLDLPGRTNFDAMLYRVGALSEHTATFARQEIRAYTRADIRLGWRLSEAVDLSIGAQDLFDRGHLEFIDNWSGRLAVTEIGRHVYGKFTFRF